LKIGKIITDPQRNYLQIEQIELDPQELPDVEKLIKALAEAQIATMQAEVTPTIPKKCDVVGCHEEVVAHKPIMIDEETTVYLWLCKKHEIQLRKV